MLLGDKSLSIMYIDDILSDQEKMPKPDFNKINRTDVGLAMMAFSHAPGAMLKITAMQLLMECKRCGGCCQYCNPISLDNHDCQVIAKFLDKTNRRIKEKYIFEDKKKKSFAIKKKKEDYCPFYEEGIGCSIYDARPSACRTFPYIQNNIIESSEIKSNIPTISNCPGSIELSAKVKAFSHALRANADVYNYAESKINNLDGMLIYILNLYLRGAEINDGHEFILQGLSVFGMSRLATDEELERISLLFCGLTIEYKE